MRCYIFFPPKNLIIRAPAAPQMQRRLVKQAHCVSGSEVCMCDCERKSEAKIQYVSYDVTGLFAVIKHLLSGDAISICIISILLIISDSDSEGYMGY